MDHYATTRLAASAILQGVHFKTETYRPSKLLFRLMHPMHDGRFLFACNFSSTLYPQSCWCIIQVIYGL
jgi:hypothetical protein